jgi:hypothetical protein
VFYLPYRLLSHPTCNKLHGHCLVTYLGLPYYGNEEILCTAQTLMRSYGIDLNGCFTMLCLTSVITMVCLTSVKSVAMNVPLSPVVPYQCNRRPSLLLNYI